MDTRDILKIVLAVTILLVVTVGGYLGYLLFKPATQQTVETLVITKGEIRETRNPWADKGDAAIALVKTKRIAAPMEPVEGEKKTPKPGEVPETEQVTVEAFMVRPATQEKLLKLKGQEVLGWKVDWWGETKYGPSYFLVRYGFKDANIEVGPSWLVNLKTQEVVPKNVLARVVMDPLKGVEDGYYDKHKQVVAAIASHRFEAGINLGGALLNYFETLQKDAEAKEGDKILGWTIEHDRGDLFRAFFQWIEAGVPTYAEFEFDYARKALRAVNFQAANVMREGEDFKKSRRVRIMAESFDAQKKKFIKGPCKKNQKMQACRGLRSILVQNDVVEALEWLLTAQAASTDAFDACKDDGDCKWSIKSFKVGEEKVPNTWDIGYIYKLRDREPKRVSWKIEFKGKSDVAIVPLDRTSTAAWRAIFPRDS